MCNDFPLNSRSRIYDYYNNINPSRLCEQTPCIA